jgi:hypothetical protein
MRAFNEPDLWAFSKVNKDTIVYSRANPEFQSVKGASGFKAETEMDCPPSVLQTYAKDFDKRKLWDEDTDHLRLILDLPLGIRLIHVKMKPQWPLGPRDSLLLYHGFHDKETGNIYTAGASIEHPAVPIDPSGKLIRMYCFHQHYVF